MSDEDYIVWHDAEERPNEHGKGKISNPLLVKTKRNGYFVTYTVDGKWIEIDHCKDTVLKWAYITEKEYIPTYEALINDLKTTHKRISGYGDRAIAEGINVAISIVEKYARHKAEDDADDLK